MRRHLGRASLAGGILAWGLLLVGLFVGGTDPDASQVAFLETATKAGLVAAIAALPVGAVAVIIGPHRLAALFGIGLSIVFFVYFAAWFTVFFTS
jgi:hypothetical protein